MPVRLRVVGPRFACGGGLTGYQLYLESPDDCLRDLVLHREDAGHLPVEAVRPDMRAIRRRDQLRGDSDVAALLANATLKHMGNAKLLPDGAQIIVLALEGEGRVPADTFEPVYLT